MKYNLALNLCSTKPILSSKSEKAINFDLKCGLISLKI